MRYFVGFDHGNPYYRDKENDNEYWLSDDEPYNYLEPRPCARCGREVTWGEPDPCIGYNPGDVAGACCGHGVEDPYIFTNGGITSKCEGLYSSFRYVSNTSGYFDKQIKADNYGMYQLDFIRYCPKYPIAVLPMDDISRIPRATSFEGTTLCEEMKNLSTELWMATDGGATLVLPNWEDACSILAAYRSFDKIAGPFWISDFHAKVPLIADDCQGIGCVAHMELFNVVPIIEITTNIHGSRNAMGIDKQQRSDVLKKIETFLEKHRVAYKDIVQLINDDWLG